MSSSILNKLAALSSDQLQAFLETARKQAQTGQVVERIPLLAKADPSWVAVQIRGTAQTYSLGEVDRQFPLMSVIKPLQLLYLLEQVGRDSVFQWVGVQPSEAAFNAIEQLETDGGFPRNPMINSGAIALAGHLPGTTATDCCERLRQWLNQQAGCQLSLDEAMLASVRRVGRLRNQTIARQLALAGRLPSADRALDTYEQICCLSGHVGDLAQLGDLLAHERNSPTSSHRRIVNALMLTCGLYEASAEVAVRVGLPMKSGISGALLAVIPGEGTIACYSPALDSIGNPVAGLAFVEQLAQAHALSVFC